MEVRTQRMGYLLKHAYVRFQAIQHEALSPFGLTGRMLAVLVEAADDAPVLQQRIGERLGVDRTSMVALVDSLEAAGFVERRSDPNDRRGWLVHLTPDGDKALANGLKASERVEAAFLEPLGPSQREQFRRLVAQLV
jgi:DNA-binding MarR family transcriptional regulator